MTDNYLLITSALLPALVLGGYIFKKDRVEKEPMGLLLMLLLFGALICIPAAFIEIFLIAVFEVFEFSHYTYAFVENFFGIALVEEGLKFIVLFLFTRKNKNFNCLFDGVVYAVFVSLGFAALENVLYVMESGWSVAILRAITAVPGHVCDGVLMGCYYSLWRMHEKAKEKEISLKKSGRIDSKIKEFSGKKFLRLALIVPVLAHGFYDFCCVANGFADFVFWVFLVIVYVYCFKKVKNMSKTDRDYESISNRMILEKYPHLLQGE